MSKVNDKFKGRMIVFTAPSGAGKTTIVRHLLKTYDKLDFSVSATTREKRPKEKEGRDYYFMSVETFKSKRRRSKFVEWEEVYENQFYGTLKSEIDRIWADKKYVVFDIDVKGAKSIKKKYGDQCLAVFIKPPSLDIIIQRLKNRKTETEASLKKRIRRIKRELKYENQFDLVLVNDLLEVALKEAELIVENYIFNNGNS